METTKEQEKIILPMNLGLIVWKELKEKHGIESRQGKMGLIDMSFSKEELALITTLCIKNPNRGALIGISQLHNLQNLTITSEGRNDYTKDNDIATISDKDMQDICKCTRLRNLVINNQADITNMSLGKLENLEFLSINNNRCLEEIDGIDSLKKLDSLSCYGNRTLFGIDKLSDCIKQNSKLEELNLDVLLFPDSINFDSRTGEYDIEVAKKMKEMVADIKTVKWHEALPRIRKY